MHQVQIAREKISRKRRDQIAEQKHRQEGQQDDQQKLISQRRPELINRLKIAQHAADHEVRADPETDGKPDDQQAARPRPDAASKRIFPAEPERGKQYCDGTHE